MPVSPARRRPLHLGRDGPALRLARRSLRLPRCRFSRRTQYQRSMGASRALAPAVGAMRICRPFALLAQLVEHFHGKEGVAGSSPAEGFRNRATARFSCFRSGSDDHFRELPSEKGSSMAADRCCAALLRLAAASRLESKVPTRYTPGRTHRPRSAVCSPRWGAGRVRELSFADLSERHPPLLKCVDRSSAGGTPASSCVQARKQKRVLSGRYTASAPLRGGSHDGRAHRPVVARAASTQALSASLRLWASHHRRAREARQGGEEFILEPRVEDCPVWRAALLVVPVATAGASLRFVAGGKPLLGQVS